MLNVLCFVVLSAVFICETILLWKRELVKLETYSKSIIQLTQNKMIKVFIMGFLVLTDSLPVMSNTIQYGHISNLITNTNVELVYFIFQNFLLFNLFKQ